MFWLAVSPVGHHLRLSLDYMHVSEASSMLQDMPGSVNVGARDVRSHTKYHSKSRALFLVPWCPLVLLAPMWNLALTSSSLHSLG